MDKHGSVLSRKFRGLRRDQSSYVRHVPGSARWWLAGTGKSLLALALVALPLNWFASHYRLVYDAVKGANCLPYNVFLVDLDDKDVRRGDYLAFTSLQMEPFYRNGTPAVKQVIGVPGDRVRVDTNGVTVNGQWRGALWHLQPGGRLWLMGQRASDVRRDEPVPAQRLWMMGTHPRSFDSRYWGYISNDQIIGRARPLW